MAKEQLNLDFPEGGAPARKENTQESPEMHEKDECNYCGAPYENERSCRYCSSNPVKKKFIREQKKK